jgi:hypothetical protein
LKNLNLFFFSQTPSDFFSVGVTFSCYQPRGDFLCFILKLFVFYILCWVQQLWKWSILSRLFLSHDKRNTTTIDIASHFAWINISISHEMKEKKIEKKFLHYCSYLKNMRCAAPSFLAHSCNLMVVVALCDFFWLSLLKRGVELICKVKSHFWVTSISRVVSSSRIPKYTSLVKPLVICHQSKKKMNRWRKYNNTNLSSLWDN